MTIIVASVLIYFSLFFRQGLFYTITQLFANRLIYNSPMKKAALFSLIIIIGLLAFWFRQKKHTTGTTPPTQTQTVLEVETPIPVEFTATFEIYTNGTKRVFTDKKYHNLSQDVYIAQENPGVIYVKKEGVTWGDFFKTLPMKLTKGCLTTGTGQIFCTNDSYTLRFFINETEDPNALEKAIAPKDFLKVVFE